MISGIVIRGDGIAATCCARLLGRRKQSVVFQANRTHTGTRPTLLINPQTQKLLGDVFEGRGEMFSDAQSIGKRVVLWGPNARIPESFPHSGLAISESTLLQHLWSNLECTRGDSNGAEWCIESTRPAAGRVGQHFGERTAKAVEVRLKQADEDACWIESLAHGWLFLVPAGDGRGSLIAVGDNAPRLLGESRLIQSQVAELVGGGVEFAAYPRIFTPLCEPGWLACGTAAMGFDPICGEGAGNAIREAILAAAVLGLINAGGDQRAALTEYNVRLLAGFLRHLELCKQFYVSGRQSEWWDAEIAALDRGIAWTRAQLAASPSPATRLIGFDLIQRSHVETNRATQQ